MNNDRNQIEDIKSRIDISEIIERYVTLKRAGKNYVGLCPFHSEKTPSFSVNPSLQMYKCFGCGESGDVIKFLEKTEHLEFVEALEKLAKEVGVELVRTKKDPDSIFSKIAAINEMAAKYYEEALFKNIQAKDYLLKDRAFKKNEIETFKIGYAPGGTALLDFIKQKKIFTKKELIAAGLFTEKNENIKDRFFERIIFPIQDYKGGVVGFTGRNLPNSKYGPKYLHTPETALFKKSQLMYGLHQGKAQIREKDLCIICEGTTDVISTHQEGVKNIVAPLGTAVTEEQLRLIGRNTKNILLLLDNDDAGKAALERYFTLGIPLDLNIYTSNTAPHKDLDELMRKEPKKIQELIDKKQDLFSYLIFQKLEKKDLTNHKDYKEIISYTSNLLSYIKDSASREFFLQKAQKITTIDSKFFNPGNTEKQTKEEEKHPQELKVDNEVFLLSLIIYFEDTTFVKKLDLKFLLNEEVRKIIEYILKSGNCEEKYLIESFSPSETLKKAILETGRLNIDKNKKDKYITSTYLIIRKQNIEQLIQKLKIQERISIEKDDNEKTDKIETDIIRLKKLLQEDNI